MNIKHVIGRKNELDELGSAFCSKRSEFIAVYGRRRIGKTHLIHHYCSSVTCVYFHVTGIKNGTYEEQLYAFTEALSKTFYTGIKLKTPNNWFDALDVLTKAISTIKKNKKVVLFFDEFPWMVTRRSRLLQALEYQWNHTWAFEGRIKLIICGSSSSWILKNIINNTGGLYNRVTYRMGLEPYTLAETHAYLLSMGNRLNHKQIAEIYMVMGGIPFYLSQVQKSYSVTQNIDKIFFTKKSNLYNEYNLLLSSLFEHSEDYDKLLREIANYRYGIGQADLMKDREIPRGGRSIKRLSELEDVGFIQSFISKGHKEKGKYYKVIDEYILFYLHWIEPNLQQANQNKKIWHTRAASTSWKIWSGIAFEAMCYKHVEEIAKKLEINPGYLAYSWRFIPLKGDKERGAQIDLLFDRGDDAITLCEIKYSDQPFVIDKEYAEKLTRKITVFKQRTRTKKQIFLSLISANGVKQNQYYYKLIDGVVTLEDLFQSARTNE
jgi:AAA+ ATPase superfamily predicted ATPase